MTVYITGRQTGKTSHLIKISEKTGAVIVAPTYQMVRYIDQMARELGLRIPPPVSVVDWVKMVARKQADPEQRYLVDELQMVLHQMNVDVATLSEDYAVDEVSVHLPTKDENSARLIRLRDIPWIEPVELKCRHFQQNTGVAR